MTQIGFWFSLVLLGAVIGLGAVTSYLELRPLFVQGQSDRQRFRNAEVGLLPAGLSTFSARFVLDDCLNAMTSLYGRLQSEARQQSVASQCRRLSRVIVARAPTDSYAHMMAALASRRLGEWAEVNRQLELSQATGPHELWVAELRYELFERELERLAEPVRTSIEADMALLFASTRGRQAIIKKFVLNSESRTLIFAVFDRMPLALREAFLFDLRHALKQLHSVQAAATREARR